MLYDNAAEKSYVVFKLRDQVQGITPVSHLPSLHMEQPMGRYASIDFIYPTYNYVVELVQDS